MLLTPFEFALTVLAVAEAAGGAALLWREKRLRKRAEQAARESLERTVEIQRLARIGNWELDTQTYEIRWSDETFRVFGRAPGSEEPDFADILLAIHPEDAPVFDRAIQRAITHGESYRLDLRVRTPDGAQKHVQAQGSPVCDENGRVVRIIGTFLDITERKRVENKHAREAALDPLTGLANRRSVVAELEQGLRIAAETQSFYAFCLCDVDNFKSINDTYGHPAGDEVLKSLARIIKAELRGQDIPGRMGGDEFCILLPRTTALQAQACAERIRRRLETATFAAGEGRSYNVTATFGISEYSPGMTEIALIEAADQALYRAKRSSGNSTQLAV
jgi:diguanylate cyclase (GGDEF)-like protein